MKNTKRYNHEAEEDQMGWSSRMYEAEDGHWVEAEDYADLKAKLAIAVEALTKVSSNRDALVISLNDYELRDIAREALEKIKP